MSNDGYENILVEIMKARNVLRGVIHKTPLDFSRSFSEMSGGKVYLKLENMQKTGSFKPRGAYYKISKLMAEKEVKGVVAASAGNHAQGVAYAASMMNLKSVIVMPITAPASKIIATKSYGAEIILHGRVYDECHAKALEVARERGYEFIHPFDDPYVIAGQGTIGLEILEDMGAPDIVVVPIGGGGLISGIAISLKLLAKNRVKIIGVQSDAAPSMKKSLEARKPLSIDVRASIADGIIVKRPGELTYKIISDLVDDIVVVSDKEIARSIFLLLERSKTVVEGAGAAALATILSGKINVEGKKVVAIVSGGNIDLTLLSKIISRELATAKRIARLEGILPDTPGSLNKVLTTLGGLRVNIIDIVHDRLDPGLDPGYAKVILTIELPSPETLDEVLEALEKNGYPFKTI